MELATKVSPEVFEELGAEVITIGNEPDGYNINQDCGSTHPEVIKEAVIKHRGRLWHFLRWRWRQSYIS
jgi:phosphoglucosamine mutase